MKVVMQCFITKYYPRPGERSHQSRLQVGRVSNMSETKMMRRGRAWRRRRRSSGGVVEKGVKIPKHPVADSRGH
jgi:hypothetical protein